MADDLDVIVARTVQRVIGRIGQIAREEANAIIAGSRPALRV